MSVSYSGNSWLAYSKDSLLFAGSQEGAKLITVSDGNRVFPIDSFASTHNRPDLLADQLDWGEADVRHYFREAVRIRDGRLGLSDKIALQEAPRVVTSKIKRSGKSAQIQLQLAADQVPLSAAKVAVNGVLASQKEFGSQSFIASSDLEVELSDGHNRIEVWCGNVNGTKSETIIDDLFANLQKASQLFCIAIGVSDYNNDDLDLLYAAKDADDCA